MSLPLIEKGHITENRLLVKNIYELTIKLPGIADLYQGPGQFISLLPAGSWENPLRRPMSIASVSGDNLSIIFKIFGQGTRKLSRLRPGDAVDVLGPLGNTFDLSPAVQPVLVGGGVGLAPILNLFDLFTSRNLDPVLILGARNEEEHFLEHEPENGVWLTTDDGTDGLQGNVMVAIEEVMRSAENVKIYGCGPEPMLKALRKYAVDNKVETEISVESYMGCGIGICQGCVIRRKNAKVNDHSYHEKYALVCMSGPVFDALEVQFG